MQKDQVRKFDVLKNQKLNFCGFVTDIAKYITLKDLRLKTATFDAAYLEPATEAECAPFKDLIAAERESSQRAPAAAAPSRPGDYPGLSVGVVALCRTTGNFGIITDIDHAGGKAKIVHAHDESWWVPLSSLDPYEPPPLKDSLRYGQFVTFLNAPGEERVGKLLEIKDGRYTALGADGKCYPKGKRYAEGDLYDLADIKPVSEGEQEKYLFKLNRRHDGGEYVARLAKTKAKWEEEGYAALLPKFDSLWTKTLALIDDKPGQTWGARVRTIYGHSPTLNIPPEYPEDLQSNMVCFLNLSNDVEPELHVFIKDYKIIPEAARQHFPASGDKKFYAGGNHTVIKLAPLGEPELLGYAQSLAAIHRAACEAAAHKN
ncbi:MAG: hypothetical protein PHV33_13070 [Elusimicrobiales bacterium]|nr:hypothetical protein [Elusimicrobiales bacterium]